jgi:hypothetical protein
VCQTSADGEGAKRLLKSHFTVGLSLTKKVDWPLAFALFMHYLLPRVHYAQVEVEICEMRFVSLNTFNSKGKTLYQDTMGSVQSKNENFVRCQISSCDK